MSDQTQNESINFDLPKNQSSVIKVIGVGGGGSNAVNYMYERGINGVDFVVTNTDAQALENSPVPNKVQLGVTLTEGLGAGANPEIGEQAAKENIDEIKSLLQTNTKMVFITAGMGGGTGTGAAPVIAKAAMDEGILTVGIVTIPFTFEGNNRKQQAEAGVEQLRNTVDAMVVINNNKLREVYGNLGFKAGFAKADEVLATASRGIAEVITHHYTANIDLRDAKTVLANSGTAIMGSAKADGENRATEAISMALDSPLLNDNHIRGAKNVLLLIVSGQEEITIDEIGEINDHIQKEAGGGANIIMGIGEDEKLGNEIGVTVVATGFNADQEVQVIGKEPQKIVHPLDDEQAVSQSVYSKKLQVDEEDDDELLDKELRKAPKKKSPQQPGLFDNANMQQQATPSPEREEPVEDKEQQEQPQEEETPKEPDPLEDPIFEIDFSADAEDEQPEETQAENQNPEEPESGQNTDRPKKYTLDDYLEVEKRLNESKPEPYPSPQRKQTRHEKENTTQDDALNFEVKRVNKNDKSQGDNSTNHNPIDSTIEESMRLRGEERRAKLKAFNYRFKNHPNSIDEADNEPAYKRQGVNIENKSYSKQNKQSRYGIDKDDDDNNLKSNNSFLHDNVD